MVRRGSVLYEALGDQGMDILDLSDPTNPQSLLGGPQATLGQARSLAIASPPDTREGIRHRP